MSDIVELNILAKSYISILINIKIRISLIFIKGILQENNKDNSFTK